jgi:F-type H+-transporting ATPase subunit b
MTIDWWTLALQAVNFLVLVWLLTRFLYRPVRRIIEARKAEVDQVRAEAEQAKSEAEAARKQYEAEQAKLGDERQEMLKKTHDELDQDRKKILGDAKAEADKMLDAAKASIEDERREAVSGIKSDVAGLAASLAGKLLASAGSPSEAFLATIEAKYNALPPEERERLTKDLAEKDATFEVVTANALSPDEQTRWSEALARLLGTSPKPQFRVDPAIIGGAALHFPHAVLGFTWADQLKSAEQELTRDGATH